MSRKIELGYFTIFAILWTLIEPIISILKLEEINPWLPKIILILLFSIPLAIYFINKFLRASCKNSNLEKSVKNSIEKGLKHLENNNLNDNGQRFRHTPSLMESTTVIGSIYLARNTLDKKQDMDIKTITWLINSLKQQFLGKCQVKYFDCYKCQNKQVCNVGYFDYLSHLYYAKDTVLFHKLENEFLLLVDIFEERLCEYDNRTGWTLYENETKLIDPLSTATILTLLKVFKYKNNKTIKKVLKTLIEMQSKNGSWMRAMPDDEYCGGEIEIITTHRVVEAYSLYKDTVKVSGIDKSLEKAIVYLKSSSGYEAPVNYELRAGMTESEVLRGMGHIIQAFTKTNKANEILEEYIRFILCKQEKDGSFIGTSDVFESNKKAVFYTDLTAFLTRTLSLYYIEKYRK